MIGISPIEIDRRAIEHLIDNNSDFTEPSIRLFKNDVHVTRTSVLADFVECNFSGYSGRHIFGWWPVWTDADGVTHLTGITQTWTSTNPLTIGNLVFGWYVTDSLDERLLCAGRFDQPIGIILPDTPIRVAAEYRFGR